MAGNQDPVSTTTYRKDYKMDKFLPAIRMTRLPMFMPGREVCTNQWRPSVKKVPLPQSSLIFARYEARGDKKPVPTPAPAKPMTDPSGKFKQRVISTKFGSMDLAEIHRLSEVLKWTPTTKASTELTHLPLPQVDTRPKTLEPKADMIRFDVHRYDVKPRLWQQAELHDRFQMRKPVERVVYPYDKAPEDVLLPKRGKAQPEPPNAEKIRSLLQTDTIASTYIRRCPGYAGYVPLMPPKDHLTKPSAINSGMISTMRATYREFPAEEYAKRQFARKGTFSKTVTLTYPFNPYNKVEVEDQACTTGVVSDIPSGRR